MKKIFTIGLISTLLIGFIIFASCSDDDTTTTTTAAATIIIFSTSGQYDGNLGGRTGADTICATNANRPSGKATVHALLSVSVNDCIANMPTLYNVPTNVPIVTTNGVVIAYTWADLIDGNIHVSLFAAGILPTSKTGYWWSGSFSNGNVDLTNNCSGWTSSATNARLGYPDNTDCAWIDGTTWPGTISLYLLGIAY